MNKIIKFVSIFLILILFLISGKFIFDKIDQFNKIKSLPVAIINFYDLFNYYSSLKFSKNDTYSEETDLKYRKIILKKMKNIFTYPILSKIENSFKNASIYSEFYSDWFSQIPTPQKIETIKIINNGKKYILNITVKDSFSFLYYGRDYFIDFIKTYKVSNMTQAEFNKLCTEDSLIELVINEKDTFYMVKRNNKLLISNIKIEYLNSKIKLINQK